ncbi:hypothetical protein [Anaeromyxobacter oryzae]|uniref:hypothetical protein n=1 Tax=Anaeromyxobacter oryzae TaxID=2918170 RepID=UPI0020BEA651|nr:hypothetical protein [Anaeromyxobacter oryzae]
MEVIEDERLTEPVGRLVRDDGPLLDEGRHQLLVGELPGGKLVRSVRQYDLVEGVQHSSSKHEMRV